MNIEARSEWLRNQRTARGITQAALGKEAVINPSLISCLEVGKLPFSDYYYRALEEYFATHPVVVSPPTSAAELLRCKRKEMGLTQTELEYMLGYTGTSTAYSWETGACSPDKESLKRLRMLCTLSEEDVALIERDRKIKGGKIGTRTARTAGSDAEWLTKERVARNLTQEQLAELMGRNGRYVCDLEREKFTFKDSAKREVMRAFQKWDEKREPVVSTAESNLTVSIAASREEPKSMPALDLDPVRKMATGFHKMIPKEISESRDKDIYATRDKNFISELMMGKIHKTLGDTPLKFLNLPHKGREIQMLKDKFNLDMKNSLGMEIDVVFSAEVRKIFLYNHWDMPIKFGDVDKYIMRLRNNPFNLIHLDYCGPLTRTRLLAVNKLINISKEECLLFLTLNTNPRTKYPVFYEPGRPPFKAPIAWHQPYFGCNGALMEVFMIHLNPSKVEAKAEKKEFMVPAALADVFTKRGWETVTEQYMKATIEKRMEIFKTVTSMLL
jgi:transcriptional regulator with XRE-family HTH domain